MGDWGIIGELRTSFEAIYWPLVLQICPLRWEVMDVNLGGLGDYAAGSKL